MDYLIVLFRTFIFYVLIIIIYRFMGKREVGQLSIIDLIVSILIAELVAISIDNREESVFLSILPIFFLLFVQILLSNLSIKFPKFRNMIDGVPSIIINNGKVNFKEMIKQRYNLDDLLTQLREKKIKSIEDVDFAILENNGNLSVFSKYDSRVGEYPIVIILDGQINYQTLRKINKSQKWLEEMLVKKKINLSQIFYAFYSNNSLYIIKNDN